MKKDSRVPVLRALKRAFVAGIAMPVLLTAISAALPAVSHAEDAKADPTIEQRVADLEAYINNTARGADAAGATVASKVASAGPGHNAWMMTSAALVLFMTL